MKDESDKEVATEKISFRFPKELTACLRAVVQHAQRSEPALTLAAVAAEGVELVILKLTKKYGVPAAPVAGAPKIKLRVGRRIGG